MASGAIRRFQDRVLGPSRTGISSSTSEIWLLGVCYKISEGESSEEADAGRVLAAFRQDFSSLILMTYRRGLYAPPPQTQTSIKLLTEYSLWHFQVLSLLETQLILVM